MFCLFSFPFTDATIGPSALWSRVQMSSLTRAQEPTSTWRSSMSVCPTVSMPPLSWIKGPSSSLFPRSSHHPQFLSSSLHLAVYLVHSFPCLVQTVRFLVCNTSQHTFTSVSSPICVTPWTFHEIRPVKTFWSSSALLAIIDVLTMFPADGQAWLWGSRIEGGHRKSCWLSMMASECFITRHLYGEVCQAQLTLMA